MSYIVALVCLVVLLGLFEIWIRNQKEPGISLKQAREGDVEAQKRVAFMYLKGQNTRRDYDKGLEWLEEAAKQHDVEAQMELADIYAAGKGIEPQQKAKYHSYVKAYKWYRMAAGKGHAEGQRRLGDAYYEGLGTNQDYAQALACYLKAVEGGDIMARYRLGCMYEAGQGVEPNKITAYRWYWLAHNFAQEYGKMQTEMADKAAALRNKMMSVEVRAAEAEAQNWLAMFKAANEAETSNENEPAET